MFKKHNPGGVLLLVLLLIVLAVSAVASYRKVISDNLLNQFSPIQTDEEPERMPIPPLAWREIYPAEGAVDAFIEEIGSISSLYSGNFDTDEDDELLLLDETRLIIFDHNGEYRTVQQNSDMASLYISFTPVVWDYDRDGIDELVPDPMQWETRESLKEAEGKDIAGQLEDFKDMFDNVFQVPVFNVEGGISAELPSKDGTCLPAVGDVDGDGFNELVACTSADRDKFVAYGVNGEIVWEGSILPVRGQSCLGLGCLGNFDHDNKEELYQMYLGHWLYGLGQERIELAEFPACSSAYQYAADVDDDGYDELLSDKGIVDLNTGKKTAYTYPAGEEPLFGDVVCGDFIEDRGNTIVVITSYIQEDGRLFIFDTDGNNIYVEDVGEPIDNVYLARAEDVNHLVMRTETRILIYP